jgi:hypothetical protein
MLEVEQHALAFRQLLAEHQAAFAFRVVDRQLDGEGVDARGADDLKSILSGGLRRREQGENDASADKQAGGATQRRLPGRCKTSNACC